MNFDRLRNFWRGKRVLVTGHTGFKGSWLTYILVTLGAEVTGLSLPDDSRAKLFHLLEPWTNVRSHFLDIRNSCEVGRIVQKTEPELVFHLAAQSLVRTSYERPVETFDINVQGTISLLEALRTMPASTRTLAITSDKVYRNRESGKAFREDDPLGGDDPYSASKAACEMAVNSWRESFGLSVVTARGGNVVGGGDFALNRLAPDLFRAYCENIPLELRYPLACRPWQHVLDVTFGYLHYLQAMAESPAEVPKSLNFGPADESLSVMRVVALFGLEFGAEIPIHVVKTEIREKSSLSLDVSLAESSIGWKNKFDQSQAIRAAARWYREFHRGESPRELMAKELQSYFAGEV